MTSVIIPCWVTDQETWSVTRDCVESFRNSGPIELIIVDNGGTVAGGYLRTEADVYIHYPQNRGYTIAMNDGLKIARGDVIAMANNDIRVANNWIDVASNLLKDGSIATVHPKMMDYDDPFVIGDLVAKTGKERWCQNSFVVTTRKFLNKMDGYFDENYGIGGGGDDWDFYFRVRKLGQTCYTNRTAFQHKHSFSLQKLGDQREKIAKQNDDYFTAKWGIKKEDWFASEFPEQMTKDWKAGFE